MKNLWVPLSGAIAQQRNVENIANNVANANTPGFKKENYIDTGKVRYVFRDFPLSSIHKEAAKAHESAHCAGDHNKYWEMHDVLFRMQKDLVVPSLKKYAANLGIDSNAFGDLLGQWPVPC